MLSAASGAEPVSVAVVGLHYGSRFLGIYQRHPGSRLIALCRRDGGALHAAADFVGVPRRYTRFEDVVRDPEIDAVHLATPPAMHAEQACTLLRAGKHVLCAPPAAFTLADCARLATAQAETGAVYMLAETDLFTEGALLLRALHRADRLGAPRWMHGFHRQDMSGWPAYWRGLPPMLYATHALTPLLAAGNGRVAAVTASNGPDYTGSTQAPPGSNPAAQAGRCQLTDSDALFQIEVDLEVRAAPTSKGFQFTGERTHLRWTSEKAHDLTWYEAGEAVAGPRPDLHGDFPLGLASHPVHRVHGRQPANFTRKDVTAGPHALMVHEFLTAINGRRPTLAALPDSLHWTAVGICADQSARTGGLLVSVPQF